MSPESAAPAGPPRSAEGGSVAPESTTPRARQAPRSESVEGGVVPLAPSVGGVPPPVGEVFPPVGDEAVRQRRGGASGSSWCVGVEEK